MNVGSRPYTIYTVISPSGRAPTRESRDHLRRVLPHLPRDTKRSSSARSSRQTTHRSWGVFPLASLRTDSSRRPGATGSGSRWTLNKWHSVHAKSSGSGSGSTLRICAHDGPRWQGPNLLSKIQILGRVCKQTARGHKHQREGLVRWREMLVDDARVMPPGCESRRAAKGIDELSNAHRDRNHVGAAPTHRRRLQKEVFAAGWATHCMARSQELASIQLALRFHRA